MSDEIQMTEDNGNGYREFLQGMVDEGFPMADGAEIAKNGIGLIQPPDQKHTNASIVASVPNAAALYEKTEQNYKEKGILLDLMARTTFRSQNEFIYFQEWVEWCEEFGTGLNAPIRYIVGINSVDGRSREQYIDAITTMRFRNYGQNNGGKPRPKFKDGELP